jgi:hypothetical protein
MPRRLLNTSLITLILVAALAGACNKVEDHADMIQQQPWLVKVAGLNLFGIGEYKYATRYLVGDTATLMGKLFLDQPGSSIEIGSVTADIIQKARIKTYSTDQRTGLPDSLDVVRFLITKQMGTGTNIPLRVHANGITIQGEPLTIKALFLSDRRTDTTLVVERMAGWLPDNPQDFAPRGTPFVHNSSVSDAGVLYFDNPYGIYAVNGEQVTPLIRQGDQLTDQQKALFQIDAVISSVISTDGSTLTFSSVVLENIPGADTLYITRLCQMNTSTRAVTTLNRSQFLKGHANYQQATGPYNGKADQLQLSAALLQTDVQGTIWFVNTYFPANNTPGDEFNSTIMFYNKVKGGYVPDGGCLFNICRLSTDGNVQSLLNYKGYSPISTPYKVPGITLSNSWQPDILLSRDGNFMYGFQFPQGGFNLDLNQYDVAGSQITNTIKAYTPYFSFISYDSVPDTRLASNSSFMLASTDWPLFRRFLVLPNNDILFADEHSLYAYDFQHMSAYCYAGTEIQYNSQQVNKTGNAKYVDFDGYYQIRFCGIDKKSTVYYCMGGSTDGVATNNYTEGVQFYKLISKK